MKKKIIYGCMVAMMCIGLTGCKGTDYKKAVEFQDKKDYVSAVALYEELGDYKDSASRLTESQTMISAIEGYNNAKTLVEEKNAELDSLILDSEAVITSGEKALDDTLISTLETAISEAKAAKVNLVDMPEEAEDITKLIGDMNAINYSSVLENLVEKKDNLENSMKQYALVNAPEEAYIITSLGEVSSVVDISAVTEDNDPNGKLNKAGGYTSQVYFSSDLLDQSTISGTSLIDKGTMAGGSIEVYATPEDAEKRNAYISGFDGSSLGVGSHTVVGTVLIRTSDKLTASQQKELEANIISALTELK